MKDERYFKGTVKKYFPYSHEEKKFGYGFIQLDDSQEELPLHPQAEYFFFGRRNCTIPEQELEPGIKVLFRVDLNEKSKDSNKKYLATAILRENEKRR
jgi:hypothetical protein